MRIGRLLLLPAFIAGADLVQLQANQGPARHPDVHFVATPAPAVDAMLELAGVTAGDVVYDLGSGDGRILIAAATKYGARGVGIELDPGLVVQARERARAAGVADRVRFVVGDIFDADISEATVVTMFLLSTINDRLRPKLLGELKPGTRIVSYKFPMVYWPAEKEIPIGDADLFFWRVPPRTAAR
jgi:SAM-dependent methyltransferase